MDVTTGPVGIFSEKLRGGVLVKGWEVRFEEGGETEQTVEPDTILLSLLPPASQETVRVFWMGELGAGSTGRCVAVGSVGLHQQTF